MTISKHVIEARIEDVTPYVANPGHWADHVIPAFTVPAYTPGFWTTVYSHDFESGVDGWVGNFDSTVTVSTEQALSGSASLKVVSGGVNQAANATRSFSGLVPGGKYRLSAHCYIPTQAVPTYPALGMAGNGSGVHPSGPVDEWFLCTEDWFEASSTSHAFTIGVLCEDPTPGAVGFFDNVTLDVWTPPSEAGPLTPVHIPERRFPGAELINVPAIELAPGATVFSDNFSSGIDNWGGYNCHLSVENEALKASYDAEPEVDWYSSLVFAPLMPLQEGFEYTFSADIFLPASSGFTTIQLNSRSGWMDAELLQDEWFTASLSFVARDEEFLGFWLAADGGSDGVVYFDNVTITKHPVELPAETVPGTWVPDLVLDYIPLNIIEANIGMDESWSPYIQGELTCWTPPEAALEQIDPRDGLRVTVTITKEFSGWNSGTFTDQTRTFDLLLRAREVDHNKGQMIVSVRSDETLLQDFARVALEAERLDTLSVKTAVIHALSKIGATLEPGATDGPIEPKTPEPNYRNLALNPRALVNTTGWVASGGTLSRLTGQSLPEVPGVTTAVRTTLTAASTGTGLYSSSDTTSPYALVTAGQKYTASMWVRPSMAISVRLDAQYYNAAGANIGSTLSSAFTLQPNVWQKIKATHTAPAGAARMGVYSYSTAAWVSGATYDVTALMLTAEAAHPDFFFDGATTDSVEYDYAWTGTANASASTSTWKPHSDATVWSPGDTAWDWLEPLFQAADLHLYADENRKWRLEPSGMARDGQLNISAQFNVTQASDSISLADNTWFDSVVIKYTGNLDVNGQNYTRYDIAGAPGTKALVLEFDRPYPGPGGAQAVLNRALGKGRVLSLSAISDYNGTPGMAVVATLPNSPVQSGVISSIEWGFPSGVMTLGSRGLTDTSDTAWILAPEGLAWNEIPAGTSWSEYTA